MPEMQFPPFALIYFVSATIILSLGAYGLMRDGGRVDKYFGIAFVLVGMWPLMYGIQLIMADRHAIETIARLTPLSMQFSPIFTLSCVYLFTDQRMPPRWMLVAMALFGTAGAFTMITNNTLHLAWTQEVFTTTPEGFNLIKLIPGAWLRFELLIYHFGVDGYIMYIAYKAARLRRPPYKTQFQLVFLGMLITVVIAALHIGGIVSFGFYNPVPVSLAVTGIIVAIAIFRYSLFTIIPYAREGVFEAIDNPALIVDSKGLLLEFNTPAVKFFRFSSGQIGRNIVDIFQSRNMDWNKLKDNKSVTMETRWGTGTNHIFSALKKPVASGDLKGSLVIFTDITRQMDAMQTAHEKEIVTYKESLLGDMHDGIGGVVATAAIVAESALDETDIAVKDNKIKQIASLLENGSYELRSMLNILDKETIDWGSLVSDMRAFSSTVLDAKSIKRRFTCEGEQFSHHIDFDKYLSIFRLFKETITNIIKHSEAAYVEITVTFHEDAFSINVYDNGKGIDMKETQGYGLKNMQRRTEKLGGGLEITSENGTNILINIPA